MRATRSIRPVRCGLVVVAALTALLATALTPALAGGPAPILFGAAVQVRSGESYAQALTRSDATFGGLEISRVFYGRAPQDWPGNAGLSGRPVVVSFGYPPADVVAGRYDAALRRWFAAAPTDREIYWSYIHEPEDNIARGQYTATTYRAAFRRVALLARQAGNPRLHATMIIMCWTVTRSGRDWHDYYAGDDVVDAIAFDCYNWGWRQQRYATPDEMFHKAVAVAHGLGKPWGITEFGSIKMSWDTDGSARASWLRDVARYFVALDPQFVMYFDVQLKTDYRLLDAPSQEAWREVVTTY